MFSMNDERGQYAPTRFPGGQECEENHPHGQRKPAAMGDLEHVCSEKRHFHEEEWQTDKKCLRAAPAKNPPRRKIEKKSGDNHRHRDGDSVCGREIRGILKTNHQADAGDQQQPVHLGDVDLAAFRARRMFYFQARQIAELHRLHGE